MAYEENRILPKIYRKQEALFSIGLTLDGVPVDWFAFDSLDFYIVVRGRRVKCSREDIDGDRIFVHYRPAPGIRGGFACLYMTGVVERSRKTFTKYVFEITSDFNRADMATDDVIFVDFEG